MRWQKMGAEKVPSELCDVELSSWNSGIRQYLFNYFIDAQPFDVAESHTQGETIVLIAMLARAAAERGLRRQVGCFECAVPNALADVDRAHFDTVVFGVFHQSGR